MTALDHLKRYPNARTTTLAHLIEREKMTARLRKEVAQRKPTPWYARIVARAFLKAWWG